MHFISFIPWGSGGCLVHRWSWRWLWWIRTWTVEQREIEAFAWTRQEWLTAKRMRWVRGLPLETTWSSYEKNSRLFCHFVALRIKGKEKKNILGLLLLSLHVHSVYMYVYMPGIIPGRHVQTRTYPIKLTFLNLIVMVVIMI